jgi:hypothetical protein
VDKNISLDMALIDSNGFVRIDAVLSNEGVMPYTINGQTLLGYLPKEELEQLTNKKNNVLVTNDHPNGLVTTKNQKSHSVGYLADDLTVDLIDGIAVLKGQVVITESNAINAIKDGKTDVSIGYSETKEFTPGTFVNDKGDAFNYDFIKKNLKLNHVAICREGRASEAALIFDNNEQVNSLYTSVVKTNQKTLLRMEIKTLVFNGQEISVAADSVSAVTDMVKTCDSLKKEMADMKSEYDSKLAEKLAELKKLEEEKDSVTAELDGVKVALELQKETSFDMDQIAEKVTNRLNAWSEIGGVDNGVVSFDANLDEAEIKRQYLKLTLKSDIELDSKPVAFIEGLFFANKPTAKKLGDSYKNDVADSTQLSSSYVKTPNGTTGFSIFNK